VLACVRACMMWYEYGGVNVKCGDHGDHVCMCTGCSYVYVYVHVYVSMCVDMYVHMQVCGSVCICLCVHACAFMFSHGTIWHVFIANLL